MGWFWQERDSHLPSRPSTKPAQPNTDPSSSDLSTSTSLLPDDLLSTLLSPSTILSTTILTSLVLTSRYLYRTHLRRIPNNAHIPPSLLSFRGQHFAPSILPTLRRHSLFGRTTSALVADPDNLRMYHTPLGLPLSAFTWTWPALISSSNRKSKKAASSPRVSTTTLSVRLAAIDAPELAHFGKPAQPYAAEALAHLRYLLVDRGKGKVRVFLARRDQYERVVGVVFVRRRWATFAEDGVIRRVFGGWRGTDRRLLGPVWHVNAGLEMVRKGWATVYEGKIGVEWGDAGMEAVYREAERRAKEEGLGMWAHTTRKSRLVLGTKWSWTDAVFPWRWVGLGKNAGKERRTTEVIETPREYKIRMKAEEAGHADAVVASKQKTVPAAVHTTSRAKLVKLDEKT